MWPILTIIIIGLIYLIYKTYETEKYVVSTVDQRLYKVLERFDDKSTAADTLAAINNTNMKLIDFLLNHPSEKSRQIGTRLKKRYRPNALIENDPPDENNTSYTEDKGKILAMCIREKSTGNETIHDHNILVFVSIHELAHIGSINYGHKDEFWNNFEYLLKAAVEAGLYVPVNYSKSPINYCGLGVNYSPIF